MSEADRIRALAELIVRFGANVQPGQIVAISSEPGKEPLTRAIAEVAYEVGAKFVDVSVFDLHLKRARALHGTPKRWGMCLPGTEPASAPSASTSLLRSRSPGRSLPTSWTVWIRPCSGRTCCQGFESRSSSSTHG